MTGMERGLEYDGLGRSPGIGNSGIGGYNGKHGFDTFSHKKPVLIRSYFGDVKQKYPPYDKSKVNFIKFAAKWFLR